MRSLSTRSGKRSINIHNIEYDSFGSYVYLSAFGRHGIILRYSVKNAPAI